MYIFGALPDLDRREVLARRDEEPHPEQGPRLPAAAAIRADARPSRQGSSFFVRQGRRGQLLATPLLIVLVLIELTDVVFAMDSIPAIFAITADPFIVYTSNIFALLGLRSLYFLLASLARRFIYLQPGLALVLVFVGVKMAARDLFHLPVALSLLVVMLLIGGSIVSSLLPNPWYAAGMASRFLIPVAVATVVAGLLAGPIASSQPIEPLGNARPSAPAAPPDVAEAPAEATKTASGLAWKLLGKGKGTTHPGPHDKVSITFTGWTPTARSSTARSPTGSPDPS